MWTANLDSVKIEGSNVIGTVTFTNSGTQETFTQDIPGNDLTPTTLAERVGGIIQLFNIRDAAIQTLTVGPITIPDLTDAQKAALAAIQDLIPVPNAQ